MNLKVAGFSLALLVLLADQASKFVILNIVRIAERGPIRVAPFFDLTMVWNRGISYGLFQQHEATGAWALVILSLAAAVGLGIWLARTQVWIIAIALGLLIGGALGNAIDRAIYGAVADFVLLYWIPFFPYVFNVADSAIVAGVALLLYDSLVLEGRRRHSQPPAETADPGQGI